MAMDRALSAGELWQAIRREAEAALAGDPVLGTSATALLEHPDLANAVAALIGERLGTNEQERTRYTRVATEAFQSEPALVDALSCDLQAIVARDPAMSSFLPPLLNTKGYVALQAWRVANWLWRRGRSDLARLMQSASSEQLQVSIHPSAAIGTSVYLDHATAIIIGALVDIGDEVTILQNVTISRPENDPRRAPRIGRGVYVGAGVTIIGDLSIGDFAKVGAGALVTSDVPAGCTAVGVPARLTNCAEAGLTSASG